MEKEQPKLLFSVAVIVYIKTLESTNILQQVMGVFSEVTRNKINIQKPSGFLCTSSKQDMGRSHQGALGSGPSGAVAFGGGTC